MEDRCSATTLPESRLDSDEFVTAVPLVVYFVGFAMYF